MEIVSFTNTNISLIILAAALALYVIINYRSNHLKRKSFVMTETAFPHSFEVKRLQKITESRNKYKSLKALAAIGIMTSLICVILLAGRPITAKNSPQGNSKTDIQLCLDVSGSSLAYDKRIIDSYRSLLNSFSGQRIGLSIFNSTSRQVFPLTTDYSLAKTRLDEGYSAFRNINDRSSLETLSPADLAELALFTKGTSTNSGANSLIGDGLAACVFSFGVKGDQNYVEGLERTKTIVFATDNELAGTPIYTLENALKLAKESSIRVESIYLSTSDTANETNATNLASLSRKYGGDYYNSDDPSMVAEVVNIINRNTNPDPDDTSTTYIDSPSVFLIAFLGLFLLYLLVEFRLNE